MELECGPAQPNLFNISDHIFPWALFACQQIHRKHGTNGKIRPLHLQFCQATEIETLLAVGDSWHVMEET